MSNFMIVDNMVRHMTTKPTTAEAALDLSIEKWETIVARITETQRPPMDGSGSSCGLCMFHWKEINNEFEYEEGMNCSNCPVNLAGYGDCNRTPYFTYHYAQRGHDVPNALAAAQAEVAFLKSLKGA